MLLLFYYGLKYIYNFSAISMSCIIPTKPSKTAVSVYILLFHQFIDFNSCVLNSNLREIIIILSSTVTVDIVEGYNLVELNKPNVPNGYKLLGCIGVSHSTTNNVAINAVANNGKLRVFNNTSKILNNIIFTGTWLLYKISK
mgnify:CR=1 FL=1